MKLWEITGRLRTTDRMLDNAIGNKSQLIVEMNPEDFLRLTVYDKEELEAIKQEALPLIKYNQWAKMGDNPAYEKFISDLRGEQQYGSVVHPFLRIEVKNGATGKVTGHEGRHRAAAILAKGGKTMPVAIALRAAKDNEEFEKRLAPEYYMWSEHLPSTVKAQFNNYEFVNTSQWNVIRDDMLKQYRRE